MMKKPRKKSIQLNSKKVQIKMIQDIIRMTEKNTKPWRSLIFNWIDYPRQWKFLTPLQIFFQRFTLFAA